MTSYSTYLQWKPLLEQFKESGKTDRLAFCRQNHINYQGFIKVLRDEKFGLIADPDPDQSSSKTIKTHIPDGSENRTVTFLRVMVRKEKDHESRV